MSELRRVYIGEVVDPTMGVPVDVYACMQDDGCLHLHREVSVFSGDVDNPVTLVTREGLLRLSRGPFENGFVEDHL